MMAVAQAERPLSERLDEQAEQLDAAVTAGRNELEELRRRLPAIEALELDADVTELAGEEAARPVESADGIRGRIAELERELERRVALLARVGDRRKTARNEELQAEQEALAVAWEATLARSTQATVALQEAGLELIRLSERDLALAGQRVPLDPARVEGTYVSSRGYRRLQQVGGDTQLLSAGQLSNLVLLTKQQRLRTPPEA